MLLALPLLTSTAEARVGDLDPAFGTNGVVITDFAGAENNWNAVLRQPDGKLVEIGTTGVDTPSEQTRFAFARVRADGSPDPSFGDGGTVIAPPLGTGGVFGDSASSGLLLPDGKIVGAGSVPDFNNDLDFALTRYNVDGSLDTSFGDGGKAVTSFSAYATISQVVLQPDGKILAVGNDSLQQSNDIVMARYLPNGSLDPSFGTGGKVRTHLVPRASASSAVVLSDGKILVGGDEEDLVSGKQAFLLLSYNNDGSRDQTFGNAGRVLTVIGSGNNSTGIAELALQPDGRILAAGCATAGVQQYRIGLARYKPNGSLDQAFGDGGLRILAVGEGGSFATTVALQPDGRFVTGGTSYTAAFATSALTLVRFNADGTTDQTFGQNGVVTTSVGVYAGFSALALQPDGKVVGAGFVRMDSSSAQADALVARYVTRPALSSARAARLPHALARPRRRAAWTLLGRPR